MKTILKYIAGVSVICSMTLSSCSEFEPEGYENLPDLPTVRELRASQSGHTVNVTWQLPVASNITDVLFIRDANNNEAISLGSSAQSYEIKGQQMGVEGLYTVKVCYDDKYVSEGVSTSYTLPVEELAGVTNLSITTDKRNVTLSWNAPVSDEITGYRIVTNGDEAAAMIVEGKDITTVTLNAQPMEVDLVYDVQAIYDTYYYSTSASVSTKIPYITPKMGYVMTANSIAELPDDDERAAASWFVQQENADLVAAADLANITPDDYAVLWIEIDRVDLPMGWENLPSSLSSDEAITALKEYTSKGGNLYLANFATQLTVPLGFVPDNMAPTVYGNGNGGTGSDVWVINPFLGVMFQNGGDQGYYDRSEHAIFNGLTLEDPNGYGYLTLPLIGPGMREDHNCLWDCNIYGKGAYKDVIANFEATTGSLVLATWGHVQDHCVAGLVEFFPTTVHGRCIANGFAAYEWNQNSGANPYQKNVEKLTLNILNYLK